VSLDDITGDRPLARYRDADGTARVIDCGFIAGCDGFHGVSRRSIPASALTEYSHEHEYGYNWLSVLAAVPTNPSGMAIHSLGLAGMIPGAPHAGRICLQCAVDDTPEQWPGRAFRATRHRCGGRGHQGTVPRLLGKGGGEDE
jgi:p-hydroxybenzoate 3-monooxygenase